MAPLRLLLCHFATPLQVPLHFNFNHQSPQKMKIFDWVHRRFAHKEGLAESGKKSCVIEGDGENSYVRDNNALNVFDGWKEGILAIGTLGYDPLKHDTEQIHESFYAAEAEKEAQENESDAEISDSDEESNPLVYAAYNAHDYDGFLEIKREADHQEFDFELEFDAMIKKERITLAELFSADSETLQKKEEANQKFGEMMMIKENKSKFSFAKKLVGDKDAHRPIHKLHRLMRMMLKRKIHPDEGLNSTKKLGTTETASLLLPQPQVADAII